MDRGGSWDLGIDNKLDALFGLEKFHKDKIELSFTEKKKFFAPFSKHFQKLKVITVAGTNGKGESSRLIQSHLRKKGLNVAVWTSPHILSVRERFIFNESLISTTKFEEGLEKIPPELSYYEGLFFLFCNWVSNLSGLDIIILEVGLGGRLDATNFFDADLVCLTSISRDHCHILGNTLEEILSEKLGVCRKKVPLISAITSDTLNKKILSFTQTNEIPWINLKEKYPNLALAAYWDQNMLLSLTAVDVLTRSVDDLQPLDLKKLPLPKNSPGRFEQMTLENRGFIFIGAHNLDGLRVLVQSIYSRVTLNEDSGCLMALSDREDDEINSMIEVILSCDRIKKNASVCYFDHPRALSREKLLLVLENREKAGKEELKFVESWIETINKSSSEKTLILGSYYFISKVQKHLLGLGADFIS
ncbi:MAG: dihydrofolate synthase/folylpolyglutamate synthase [Bacteriovoracaceae bacterium]|jgi:dihydrofolate synthase/folylpolyglutamate synthase